MGVFAREVIRKLICVSGKGAADDWHGGGTETKGQKSFSAHNQGGAMPQKIKKGRMINMKMKKFLSSLTAGVMAATIVFTSALVTPVMSFIATAADADAIGTATLVGVVGANTNWEADVNATSITGDGEYTVSWNLDSASDSISFLTVQISKAGDTENFTTDTFKDLKVSLSSVSINGEEVADAVKDDKIVDTAFYEGGNAGTTRIYLNGSWADNHAGALDNFDTTKVENGISKISVTFTVEGTGKTTTTTTSETTAETTETTVSSAVSSDVSSETSESVVTTASASSAETVTTTTAPAIKDVEAKITTGTQKGTDGDIQAYAEFDPNGAKSATLYYTVTSKDTESSGAFGTYNGDWFQEEFKASVGANGACTADYTIPSNVGKTVKAMIFYPDASSVKIDKVVLHYDSAVTTSATTTSVTTTTEAAKYTKVLTPKAEEDKGTDGKASNTKVEFDPMGAYKAIAYYTVKTNDTNTSGAFGTWNDSLPEGEEWQSEEFKDLAVPANKQVVVSYNIPKTVGETVQFMVYYPKFGDVTIDKIVLCFDEDPDATTTSVSSTTEIKTTASSVSSETETTASATTKGTESSASETKTSATSATTKETETSASATTKETETSASATTKDTESSATSATTKTDKATETSATEKATTVTSTTKQSATTTATDAPKGKGIVIDIGEANAEPGEEGVELPFYLQKYIPSEGFSFAIDVPMVTAKILSINKTEVSKDGVDEYVSGSVRRTSNTAGFEAFGADESAAPEDRWMYFMWTVSAGTATIPDEENGASNFMNMYFDIADNAADVAAEYGLELQTDADGNTYYFFPVNFAQYQKVNWDFSGTAGSAYIMPNQQFLDDSSNDLATTDVTYYNGGFRVYTDKKDVTTSSTADTTTSITTTTTTTTVTTTTTTKASTTTTKASATTTTKASTTSTTKASTTSTTKASVTTTTKESTTTTKASATTTTKASTTTTEEATSTTTTEKTTVSETSGTTTTKATESEAPVSTTTVESTTTERGTFTKKTTTVTTTTEDANYTKVSRPTGTTTTETTTSAENTTTSSETTTSTGSSSDTVTSTTTTETQPAGKPDVKVKEDANFYLSEDTRAFDPADLVESATLDGEDILSQLTFEYASPKDMYDALHGDIAYVASDLKVLYNGEEVGTAKVYIGIKGDTDLNGKVEATDMFYNMYYQARLGAGIKEGVTLLENNQDENLEKLSYFLTDIDTESKEGKNTADKSITPTDLFYQMYYIALKGAGYKDTVWTDVCPDLKNLQGSCWYEAK